MHLWWILQLAALAHLSSAHYIFDTLVAGSVVSRAAVRRPRDNGPVLNITSPDIRCNVNLNRATETVSVPAGSRVGFVLDNAKTIYHLGPAAMYMGKAPGKVEDWDGSGESWFKIAHWGAAFSPKFTFITLDEREFYTTIPKTVPSGEYLLRMEQIGLHQPGMPEFFMSCAQIRVTDGGSGNPPMYSIPGYLSPDDPGLTVDIYWPVPTSYETI
ncbi:hypothetical protein CC1G_02693 [Coprinopsis cinerea okayama7|uniref:AA9 family lytic polysaccharide monooxygenase n=1 Tax=Coprinopsis cinerea (strain Okayama-7 / 130 / ATCC MYA-4618 / FGSC 9003) TaxID=240176 RepID=A8PBN8_COPC7|nr:hypothetical protein CC1G_02693 [Coprinopsis cinerea okayama7\|eukprot:XP_001840230.2 hypothetical protein CC1G_02693 [Coprinopsis cinerea okayama7\